MPGADGQREAQHHDDTRYAFKGGVLQMLGVLGNGLMAVHHVLVARLFGQANYGLYSGTLLIVEIASRFCCLGADKGLHRYVAGHRAAGEGEGEARALGTGLRNALAASALFVIVAILGSGGLGRLRQEPWLELTLPYMSPGVLGAAVMLVLVAAALARRAPRVSLAVRGVAEPGFLVLTTVLVGWLWPHVLGLALAYGFAYLATAAVAVCLTRRVFGRHYMLAAMRLPAHRPFIRFSLSVAVLELVNMLRQRLDGLIVFAFFSFELAALYLASEFIGRVAASVRNAFDGISGPMFAESLALGERERLRVNLQVLTRWVTTLSLPLASTLIALREDLLYLSGPGFVAAASLVLFHVAGYLLNAVFGVTGNVLMMGGRTRLLMANQIGAGLLNALICSLLIPVLGLVGAAIGFLASYAASLGAAVVQVWTLQRIHPFHFLLLKPVLAGTVTGLCQMMLAAYVDPWPLRVAAVLLAGAGVQLLMLWALGLPEEERLAVRSAAARLRRQR